LNSRIIAYIILLFVFTAGFMVRTTGQETQVNGKIIDAFTGLPLPYVNVYFKGTTIGVTTDLNGLYSLKTSQPVDSIRASFIGYDAQTLPVITGVIQTKSFFFVPSTTNLKEIEIIPEERWVDLLMRRVIRNKSLNNPDQIEYYQCEVYNKIQIDLNNISGDLRERWIFRPIDFVFDYIDTSNLNQKVFIPALISESISEVYFRKSPRTLREFIKASRISGIDNQSLTQYLGGLFQNVNIYDNYLNIFDKNFVSPIANFAFSNYAYILEDTVVLDGKTCYQVRFEPKRKQELTFYGTIWIHDSTFAVKQVNLRVSGDANFNWISDFYLAQSYDKVNDQYWVLTHDYRVADMNPFTDNLVEVPGFFGHRTSRYYGHVFDQPMTSEFYTTPTEVIVLPEAYNRDDTWWGEFRPDTLNNVEKQIYRMVDSVKSVPAYKYYEKAGYLIGTGYYIAGKFEIGPVFKFFSFNSLEGARFRLGGRTSNDFSKRIMLEGHAAYGTKDQVYKYQLGAIYMLMKNPRRSIGGAIKYDIEQLGQDPNAFSEDNFFASFLRRSPADKLTMVREYKAFYEHEWFTGFSNTLRFIRREVFPIGDEEFIINDEGNLYIDNSLVSNEIQLYTRFAYREKYFYGEFERMNLGTRYPVLELFYGYGIPGFPDSDVDYHRLQFKINHWFNVFNIGWSKYIFETGKFWGKLTYPLLKVHAGNETFFFYPEAGNLMNYYEFISDTYATLYYTHHFDGLFLNRIPLMRKLKWREVIHARAVWGSLTDENKQYSVFPDDSGEVTNPYFEAGVGIENIFRVGRIDAIWRLSHMDNPGAKRFGIFISYQFYF